MSENSGILSGQNQQTVAVVAFVLALLATIFNLYTYNQMQQTSAVLAGIDAGQFLKYNTAVKDLNARVDALQKQVDASKQAAAAAPAEEAPAEEGGGE